MENGAPKADLKLGAKHEMRDPAGPVESRITMFVDYDALCPVDK